MHLSTYTHQGHTAIGQLAGDRVIPIPGYTDMLAFVQAGPAAWQASPPPGASLPADQVELQAPLSNPTKVVAIGLNYMDHCREQHVDPPSKPLVFAKFPSAIVGPGAAIAWDPQLTAQVDVEVELGVVVGRPARRVARAAALSYVFGYTVLNDVSARDVQFGDGQWVRGKSLDTFCPLGPVIVTADEIPDPQTLRLRCLVNETPWQDSSTAEMIFDVAELISYLSYSFTLYPGDIIATGTPYGVGVFRDPPLFLHDGDRVVAEIEGIGRLENHCAARAQPLAG
ncbi:MAG TPA: fumarylacetoacetate hydrolase family protein [Chloroflexia bacterium]|nr:fumarylacetoacetate hydrolase family protein [Chloroflexia bacterium]